MGIGIRTNKNYALEMGKNVGRQASRGKEGMQAVFGVGTRALNGGGCHGFKQQNKINQSER